MNCYICDHSLDDFMYFQPEAYKLKEVKICNSCWQCMQYPGGESVVGNCHIKSRKFYTLPGYEEVTHFFYVEYERNAKEPITIEIQMTKNCETSVSAYKGKPQWWEYDYGEVPEGWPECWKIRSSV